MASIIGTETGFGRNSRALRDYNNPAGLMAGGKGNKEFYKFDTLEQGLAKSAEVQRRVYTRGGETIPGMGKIYAPPGAANDPHKTNALWPGLVSGIQKTLKDPGYDPGGLQDAAAPTVQTAGLAPLSSLPIGFRGGARAAEEAMAHLPTPDQKIAAQAVAAAPVAFRRGAEPATEAEAHIPSSADQQALLEGRQEGGPVQAVKEVTPKFERRLPPGSFWKRAREDRAFRKLFAKGAQDEERKEEYTVSSSQPAIDEWTARIERALGGGGRGSR